MLISIISPCRDEVGYIDRFLESVLCQQCDGFGLEIIIADGQSTDGTTEKLRRWTAKDDRIKVIENPRGIVSAGLNLATTLAAGEMIVRMDVHTSYAEDYVRQCVKALRSSGAQCVGGPWVAAGESVKEKAIANAFQSTIGSGGAASRRRDYSGPTDTVYLGAWYKRDLVAIGGFDEELVRNQDDELCLRFTRAGGVVWQSASIHSVYRPRSSFRALMRQFQQYGYWKALVIRKYHVPASVRQLVPFAFVVALVVLTAIAPFSTLAAGCLGTIVICYAGVTLVSSWTVRGGTGLRGAIRTAMAMWIMHLAYGYGFGRGVFDFFVTRRLSRTTMHELTR